jgi:hypothetical protein
MMESIREITQGQQGVGLTERIQFALDVSAWGNTPTSLTLKSELYDMDDKTYSDNTTTVFPSGAAAAVGNIITLPVFLPHAIGELNRISIGFTCAGAGLEAYAFLMVEK